MGDDTDQLVEGGGELKVVWGPIRRTYGPSVLFIFIAFLTGAICLMAYHRHDDGTKIWIFHCDGNETILANGQQVNAAKMFAMITEDGKKPNISGGQCFLKHEGEFNGIGKDNGTCIEEDGKQSGEKTTKVLCWSPNESGSTIWHAYWGWTETRYRGFIETSDTFRMAIIKVDQNGQPLMWTDYGNPDAKQGEQQYTTFFAAKVQNIIRERLHSTLSVWGILANGTNTVVHSKNHR